MLMRVDGSIVRVRETRLFHRFQEDDIIVDTNTNTNTSDTDNDTTGHHRHEARIHVVVTWRELNLLPDVDSTPVSTTTSSSTSSTIRSTSGIPPQISAPFTAAAAATPQPPGSIAPRATGNGNGNAFAWGALRPQELRNPAWVAERVPEVNARDGIQQFFTLSIPY